MVQRKKPEIRAAIIDAADGLFRKNGYAFTTMSAIARQANTSPANIYVYFDSKLDILLAVYEPWLKARIEMLAEHARQFTEAETRLKVVLKAIWHEIPSDDNCFANNLVQALAVVRSQGALPRNLLRWCESQITEVICEALPEERRHIAEDGHLAHLVFMAYDGFAVHNNLSGPSDRIDDVVELATALILGRDRAA
ncbi:TetR/AcrR family transcriptional regulator [Rhodosalinus halophilus]|uniref:TetR/AcrR family transcriptional regulator n=1 Tax=Rhodosalinus halophilus TaxID=2259333 RepID=A0A365U603_9RHOB|nr:TetR/AcrR family transcriptional regulator [Rhodosalinus halophilus]RBI82942.1 TetR/AcrR family transcriptional regulator [Rhodosalinus halophilus]